MHSSGFRRWNGEDTGGTARVPLASGLLSAKYTKSTPFAENDHRTYNPWGEALDVGETFSGVDFATGIEAVREFAARAGRHHGGAGRPRLDRSASRGEHRDPGSQGTPSRRAPTPRQAPCVTWATTSGEASARSTTAFRATVHSRW